MAGLVLLCLNEINQQHKSEEAKRLHQGGLRIDVAIWQVCGKERRMSPKSENLACVRHIGKRAHASLGYSHGFCRNKI